MEPRIEYPCSTTSVVGEGEAGLNQNIWIALVLAVVVVSIFLLVGRSVRHVRAGGLEVNTHPPIRPKAGEADVVVTGVTQFGLRHFLGIRKSKAFVQDINQLGVENILDIAPDDYPGRSVPHNDAPRRRKPHRPAGT